MIPARIARGSLLLLTVSLLAIWLPLAKDKLFEYRFGKTHMFYSPVAETFIYKELLGEGHAFIYRDREGNDYSRQEFESMIPFIYYKNMDIWGKLPLQIGEQRFDIQTIRDARQVMELKPDELPEHAPRIQLFPLLESNPGRARLSFPENVFRPGEQLEFIDTDHNHRAPAHAEPVEHAHPSARFTELYTAALSAAGFQFPVQATFGRVSILKAFDAGYFLLDTKGQLFHLMRRDAEPVVKAVALPEGVKVRHVKVTENKRREILGFLLDQNDNLYLMKEGSYQLIPLELPGYKPDEMELKVIFNPLYRSAIYSDRETIRVVAMDTRYQVIDQYSRVMAMAAERLPDKVMATLAPFSLSLHDPDSRYLSLRPVWHGWQALAGCLVALVLTALVLRWRGYRLKSCLGDLLLVALTGLYGLLALMLVPPDRHKAG
ncbi:DUF4857 domain-containing protein [Marinobacterium stanieri]|uniref:DUF4857 domain-containing protein n=1 Tax=Marinobacterium stanieri TaxID=49186 RepID=UPI000255A5A9|nr:DUF4857 domain-containing protein [Marinobacterium stanieri]